MPQTCCSPTLCSGWILASCFLTEKWYSAAISVVSFLSFAFWAPTVALLRGSESLPCPSLWLGFLVCRKLFLLYDSFGAQSLSCNPLSLLMSLSFALLHSRRLASLFGNLGTSAVINKFSCGGHSNSYEVLMYLWEDALLVLIFCHLFLSLPSEVLIRSVITDFLPKYYIYY